MKTHTSFSYLFFRLGFVLLLVTQISIAQKKRSEEKGFTTIFNSKNLEGWEGEKTYWRVENGVLTGEVTPQTILKQNTFLIWKGGEPENFELFVNYRISAKGNSGVNYRSIRVDSLPYALKGYQADLDGKDKYNLGYPRHSGQNYEERGRQFLATRGQKTIIENGKAPLLIDSLGSKEQLLKSIHYDDWNELHIIAKGNNLKHYINGKLMSEVTDNDTTNRKMKGLIGVQVHVGPPMKIEFKDFRLKLLN
ncbi:MAG: 3-keto-disaccharide hydrolase [Janthinobacterium lividum]